jgi:hypothetical protein
MPVIGDPIGRLLHASPDHPPIRLILRPGEGYHLPVSDLIVSVYPRDKQEPDVMLLVFKECQPPA